jgi:hypothetical protein
MQVSYIHTSDTWFSEDFGVAELSLDLDLLIPKKTLLTIDSLGPSGPVDPNEQPPKLLFQQEEGEGRRGGGRYL